MNNYGVKISQFPIVDTSSVDFDEKQYLFPVLEPQGTNYRNKLMNVFKPQVNHITQSFVTNITNSFVTNSFQEIVIVTQSFNTTEQTNNITQSITNTGIVYYITTESIFEYNGPITFSTDITNITNSIYNAPVTFSTFNTTQSISQFFGPVTFSNAFTTSITNITNSISGSITYSGDFISTTNNFDYSTNITSITSITESYIDIYSSGILTQNSAQFLNFTDNIIVIPTQSNGQFGANISSIDTVGEIGGGGVEFGCTSSVTIGTIDCNLIQSPIGPCCLNGDGNDGNNYFDLCGGEIQVTNAAGSINLNAENTTLSLENVNSKLLLECSNDTNDKEINISTSDVNESSGLVKIQSIDICKDGEAKKLDILRGTDEYDP
jgi:hypothetical protein